MTRKELQARFRADPSLKNKVVGEIYRAVAFTLEMCDTHASIEDLLSEQGTAFSDRLVETVADCCVSLETAEDMTDDLALDILLDACEHDTGERNCEVDG